MKCNLYLAPSCWLPTELPKWVKFNGSITLLWRSAKVLKTVFPAFGMNLSNKAFTSWFLNWPIGAPEGPCIFFCLILPFKSYSWIMSKPVGSYFYWVYFWIYISKWSLFWKISFDFSAKLSRSMSLLIWLRIFRSTVYFLFDELSDCFCNDWISWRSCCFSYSSFFFMALDFTWRSSNPKRLPWADFGGCWTNALLNS